MTAPDCAPALDWLRWTASAGESLALLNTERRTLITRSYADGDIVALYERVLVRKSDEGNVYVHRWLNSDEDCLHDHPWDFVSLILRGGYWEERAEGRRHRRTWHGPGAIIFHRAEDAHRIVLDAHRGDDVPVSLVITGPERRLWGFHTDAGWVDARTYRFGATP